MRAIFCATGARSVSVPHVHDATSVSYIKNTRRFAIEADSHWLFKLVGVTLGKHRYMVENLYVLLRWANAFGSTLAHTANKQWPNVRYKPIANGVSD